MATLGPSICSGSGFTRHLVSSPKPLGFVNPWRIMSQQKQCCKIPPCPEACCPPKGPQKTCCSGPNKGVPQKGPCCPPSKDVKCPPQKAKQCPKHC